MERRQAGEYTTYETRGESHDKTDKNRRYKEILGILRECPEGLTAKEVAVLMCYRGYTYNEDRNNSAPRLTELMQQGKVEPIGKKLCQYTGRKVAVFAIREEEK